jgi:hypothetical protein
MEVGIMSQAYDVGCPTCGVPAGEKCVYLKPKSPARKVRLRTSDNKLLNAHPARWKVRRAMGEPIVDPRDMLRAINCTRVMGASLKQLADSTRECTKQVEKMHDLLKTADY